MKDAYLSFYSKDEEDKKRTSLLNRGAVRNELKDFQDFFRSNAIGLMTTGVVFLLLISSILLPSTAFGMLKNAPPTPFALVYPGNGESTDIILELQWDASSDADGLTYTVLLSRDQDFSTIDYMRAEIPSNGILVGPDANLMEGTTYYWKVLAVDSFGEITESCANSPAHKNCSQTWQSFNAGGPPPLEVGQITGRITDSSGQAVIGATITSSSGDFDTSHSPDGSYYLVVPAGAMDLTVSPPLGYEGTHLTNVSVADGQVLTINFTLTGLAINGVCGSSNGGAFTSKPATNLCDFGTPSSVSGSGPWTWSCAGSNGGTTANCSANIQTGTVQTWTVSAAGGTGGTISPASRTVNHGSKTTFTVTPNTGYTATMGGTCGGSPASGTSQFTYTTGAITTNCTVIVTFTTNPVNGVCGSSNGGTFTSRPTANLCKPGTPSSVSGSGPWTWTCAGSNGGTTANCSASIKTWTVSAAGGTGGTISPASRTVNHGSTTTFTVTPNTGYTATMGGTCGGLPASGISQFTYTTDAITTNCTVTATFTSDTLIATASPFISTQGDLMATVSFHFSSMDIQNQWRAAGWPGFVDGVEVYLLGSGVFPTNSVIWKGIPDAPGVPVWSFAHVWTGNWISAPGVYTPYETVLSPNIAGAGGSVTVVVASKQLLDMLPESPMDSSGNVNYNYGVYIFFDPIDFQMGFSADGVLTLGADGNFKYQGLMFLGRKLNGVFQLYDGS